MRSDACYIQQELALLISEILTARGRWGVVIAVEAVVSAGLGWNQNNGKDKRSSCSVSRGQ